MGCLATLRLAQLWIGGVWPWLAALAFALTPVSLWQTTAAGAPDIWMCALVPLSLLAILKSRGNPSAGLIILAGILAGAIAGTKYTGMVFATALLVGFVVAAPSARKGLLFFVFCCRHRNLAVPAQPGLDRRSGISVFVRSCATL